MEIPGKHSSPFEIAPENFYQWYNLLSTIKLREIEHDSALRISPLAARDYAEMGLSWDEKLVAMQVHQPEARLQTLAAAGKLFGYGRQPEKVRECATRIQEILDALPAEIEADFPKEMRDFDKRVESFDNFGPIAQSVRPAAGRRLASMFARRRKNRHQ